MKIKIEKSGKVWLATFAPLEITSQGKTERSARKNLFEALNLFLETASAREVFTRMNDALESNGRLAALLTSPAWAEFFGGRAYRIKAEIIATLLTGNRSLYSIAKEYGVSKQSVHHQAARARVLFGTVKPRVD